MLALLLALACQTDVYLDKDVDVPTVPNPPDLNPPTQLDIIKQVVTPEVDVLWVIDDSCSMSEEQRLLRDNFPVFMEFFLDSGLDWHIGITTTDTDPGGERGRLVRRAGFRYLDPTVNDPIGIFSEMANLGTNGSGDEKGRRAAWLALTDPLKSTDNRGFYRDQASLHVIVISDELDYSANQPTQNEFINFLTTLKEDPEMVTFSSIVGPRNGCVTAVAGSDYIAVTEAVGGISYSICETDWTPVLEQLGLQATGLKREYFLSEVPIADTLEVTVVDGEYTYDGALDVCDPSTGCAFTFTYNPVRNSIFLTDFVPNPLADVEIRYTLLR